jgi:hypothetical protein
VLGSRGASRSHNTSLLCRGQNCNLTLWPTGELLIIPISRPEGGIGWRLCGTGLGACTSAATATTTATARSRDPGEDADGDLWPRGGHRLHKLDERFDVLVDRQVASHQLHN